MLQPDLNLAQGERLIEAVRKGQVTVTCEELPAEWQAVPEVLSAC